jgi:CPA2 family monovalent cation:H+ antiporter-2
MAWLTSSFGLSLALGAFIAGLAVSASPYSHQVFAEVLPFRDMFMALFFVSVGMLLDLQFLAAHWPVVLLAVGATILGKALVGAAVVRALSGSTRLALRVGLATAQLGELAFVLAEVGAHHEILAPATSQTLLATAVLSMLATPLLVAAGARAAAALPDRADSPLARERDAGASPGGLTDHVVIVGWGVNGRTLARSLREQGLTYCVLELNPENVRQGRRAGEPLVYGDAARPEILRLAGLGRARVLAIATPDSAVARAVIGAARTVAPRIAIVARTRFAAHERDLRESGADEVVVEETQTARALVHGVLGLHPGARPGGAT